VTGWIGETASSRYSKTEQPEVGLVVDLQQGTLVVDRIGLLPSTSLLYNARMLLWGFGTGTAWICYPRKVWDTPSCGAKSLIQRVTHIRSLRLFKWQIWYGNVSQGMPDSALLCRGKEGLACKVRNTVLGAILDWQNRLRGSVDD